MHTLQLGGHVFNLASGVSSDGTKTGAAESIAAAIAELRAQYGDRQGLRITFLRLDRRERKLAQVVAWVHPAGKFSLQTEDQLGVSSTEYTNMGDLFDALSSHATQCSFEWNEDVSS